MPLGASDRDASWSRRSRCICHSNERSRCHSEREQCKPVWRRKWQKTLAREEAASPESGSGELWWCCGTCGTMGLEVHCRCCQDSAGLHREAFYLKEGCKRDRESIDQRCIIEHKHDWGEPQASPTVTC